MSKTDSDHLEETASTSDPIEEYFSKGANPAKKRLRVSTHASQLTVCVIVCCCALLAAYYAQSGDQG